MDSERWRKVEELYHSALEIPASQRSGFLRESCGDDEALRNEVKTLLAYQTKSEAFIEMPAMEAAARILAQDPGSEDDFASVPAGVIVSRYRILERSRSNDRVQRRILPASTLLPLPTSR
jgi:hypothetical protein